MPIAEHLLAQVLSPPDETQLNQTPGSRAAKALPVLTPSQRHAAGELGRALQCGSVAELRARSGMGRSVVLREISATHDAVYLDVRDFVNAWMAHAWSSVERATCELFEQAMASSDVVVIDDLHLITAIVDNYNYTSQNLFDAALASLLRKLPPHQKLLFGTDMDGAPDCVTRAAIRVELDEFNVEDYRHLVASFLGATAASALDLAHIYRYAPALSAAQIHRACTYLSAAPTAAPPDTNALINYLKSVQLASNVTLDEVQAVTWSDLCGVDDVVEALEAKIALPLENSALASAFHLKPKRGVLLAGPPGTGKTTIGRALAHRLKGKFFLIDGTIVAGSNDFYKDVGRIFEAAKQNAPSVIFIDDADVIFENESERGFYRYLLTLLDGMESARAERVCVMLTAMNVSNLPAALLRSGRIELWLEMRLPDEAARISIIAGKLAGLPQPIGTADARRIAAASRGLTGADIKAMVEDAKLLLAHDLANGRRPREVEDYFREAIHTIALHKKLYDMRKSSPLSETVRIGYPIATE